MPKLSRRKLLYAASASAILPIGERALHALGISNGQNRESYTPGAAGQESAGQESAGHGQPVSSPPSLQASSQAFSNDTLAGIPILDAHVHLFDPDRRGGVPWPEKSDTVLYRPAMPARYRSLARPFGVVGAIAIECSPLPADNDWLLRTAATDPLFVGVIGDLDPADAAFGAQLERLRKDPLFRGIRYGNLWNRDLGAHLTNPAFTTNLKLLPQANLLLESANPNPDLIAALLQLTDLAPNLRIVVDHLPQAVPPDGAAAKKAYLTNLASLAQRPQVFVKGSEVLRRIDGQIPMALELYRGWLDQIWELFGEDRLFYGGDWPNSDHMRGYRDTLAIIREYVAPKGVRSAEKFFFRNSIAVYGWKPRDPGQRSSMST